MKGYCYKVAQQVNRVPVCNNCMTWKEWQLYELSNDFTVWQCKIEKVVRDVYSVAR